MEIDWNKIALVPNSVGGISVEQVRGLAKCPGKNRHSTQKAKTTRNSQRKEGGMDHKGGNRETHRVVDGGGGGGGRAEGTIESHWSLVVRRLVSRLSPRWQQMGGFGGGRVVEGWETEIRRRARRVLSLQNQ